MSHPESFAARRRLLAAGAGLAIAAPAWAQPKRAWPSQPVKILVGFPGGSTPDVAARIVGEALAKTLGQPVVIENRPGASGNIAADLIAKARDDHTLGVVINGNLTSAKLLNPKLPYDPASDFSFVSLLATAPLVLVTNPDKPAGAEFFAAARNAGRFWSYGSVGIGSVGHLGMEVLKERAAILQTVHVPFNGNPAVITALIQGEIQMALIPPGLALPQVKAGKLRAIGLTGGASPLAPETPSIAAAGVAMDPLEVWTAIVGPATLSEAARTVLAAEVPAAIRSAEVSQRLFGAGWQAQGSSADVLKLRVQREASILGSIILSQNIKVE